MHFLQRPRQIRKKHHAQAGSDAVKTVVRERKIVGIGLLESGVGESALRCALVRRSSAAPEKGQRQ